MCPRAAKPQKQHTGVQRSGVDVPRPHPTACVLPGGPGGSGFGWVSLGPVPALHHPSICPGGWERPGLEETGGELGGRRGQGGREGVGGVGLSHRSEAAAPDCASRRSDLDQHQTDWGERGEGVSGSIVGGR